MAQQNRAAAISFIQQEEGAYPHGWNPRDPSYCGITLPEWNRMREEKSRPDATVDELRAIQPAEIEEFYGWKLDRIGFDEIATGLDYAVADAAVNEGEGAAKALLTVTSPLTLDVEQRIHAISDCRLAVKKLRSTWSRNGAGWSARIGDRVVARAVAMLGRGA